MKCFVLDGEFAPNGEYLLSDRELADHRSLRSNFVWKNLRTELVDRPIPGIKDNEVLIKVGACGICGSDVHARQMEADTCYTKFAGHLRLPVIMGHELSGEIVEVGKNVKGYSVGDLIAVEQVHWCGECFSCRMGMFNKCLNLDEVGLTCDGGFAEYAAVPEKYCCKINDIAELLGSKMAALEAGALSEPAGVAYNGMVVMGGGVKPGSNVAIFGAGPIGLCSISLARAAGAAIIFAFETVDKKKELAKIAGADYVYNPVTLAEEGTSAADVVADITHGVGCKMVVEAAGNPNRTYPEILKLMSIGAMVVQIGMYSGPTTLSLTPFQLKLSSLCGTNGTAGSEIIPSVLRLMAQGVLDMRKIVTGRYNINDIEKAIAEAEADVPGKLLVSQFY